MDKLIALLDEYEGQELEHTIIDGNVKRRVKNIIDPDKPYKWSSVWWYSKSFGFIKWLIDNDKIDRHSNNLELDMKRMRIPQDYYISGGQSLDLQHKKTQYLSLIALLAIQDNPIEFLVSILK